MTQSTSPDVLVTFRPHKLVKLIQGSKVTLGKQRRPPSSLKQLLPHTFIPKSVQKELQLQNPFQPFLFHLFTLELLTTCCFLNTLLDLSKATDCGRHSHLCINLSVNFSSRSTHIHKRINCRSSGYGREQIKFSCTHFLTQCQKALVQFPCKLKVMDYLLVLRQGFLD